MKSGLKNLAEHARAGGLPRAATASGWRLFAILLILAGFALSGVAQAQVTGQPGTGEGQAAPVPEAPVVGQDGIGDDAGDSAGPAIGEEDAPATSSLFGAPAVEEEEARPLDPFAAMLTRRGPSAIRLSSRTPQLYKTTEGDETFVFQADGSYGFIRFPCDGSDETLECALLSGRRAEEILILDATRSPRGDVTYTDQSGTAVLRVTSNGGATLFVPEEGFAGYEDDSIVPLGGRAVLPVGKVGGTLKSPPMAYEIAAQRMRRASEVIEQRHGFYITFMAPGTYAGNQAVLADAVLTTAKGIDQVAADPLGARIVAERLAVVEFVPDAEPSMKLQDGALTVFYNPAAGLQGRPSSLAVTRYLEGAL
ncbi:DUF4908 domain-containing protein [Aquisalinus flavus]|uniref:DUF4908 domain-containing protein n=1 Tax=Aquisalinus flavus TaxID=1526572 RepID=A0A8J2V5D9_9PROT|nr:DUF4908 domain-containing protein [Aquisalinus flavus]MBD0426119.1 DUF4908 domain-containing protein [Aquisalinus flavus]UNE48296.1 DUF4908 domain-containing protein [Aquisalinus flavus]GGD10503.1 hypothetical protein GCM10011342_19200 [Aquisalinus flavus]